nr:VWA containing CoxE family protein [Deltaproteobacteria bacterium]
MKLDPKDDPAAALDELSSCTSPWLFGVRHHSPACSIALPPLLDKLQPTAIAIELPEDLGHWMEWLGHPAAEAPLAVAAVSKHGADLGFYPFADFSPELVAIRWARAHDVPLYAIDLPSSSRGGRDHGGELLGIGARLQGADDDSWEYMVEAPATAQEAERVRRAALLYGWALRLDQARGSRVSQLDLAREAHMRSVLERIGAYPKKKSKKASPMAGSRAKVAAIIGSFHAAALVPEPTLWQAPSASSSETAELVSSLIPYAFELLDARSGYPAGIRDPSWHQRLWQTQRDRGDVAMLVSQCLVEITRLIRAKGLPASVPDARAAAEIAISLAALRGLAAPGRRELVEGVQTALSQGELMGRGRIVASAMEQVMVGRHRGHLAPGTPRSGLAPHVFALMDELRLPGVPAKGKPAMTEPEDIRLDPLRSPLDRRRHVALARMRACGVPYGTELESVAAGGVESLTSVWRVMFTPATEAVIELAGLRGVTLRQAAMGALRAEALRLAAAEALSAKALVALTETAAEAGAGELVREWLAELTGKRLAEATLGELIALIAAIDRILAGHVVALPADADDAVPGEIDVFESPVMDRAMVLGVAVASILGLAGSESLDDARALAELVRLLERPEHQGVGDGRLRWSLDQLVETGTPTIAGAAEIVRVLIGTQTAEVLAQTIGAWIDVAVDADARRMLANRLRGAISIAGPLFESAPV